jgi:hypothetical protein
VGSMVSVLFGGGESRYGARLVSDDYQRLTVNTHIRVTWPYLM